jgi:hypothetical protein
VKFLKSIFNPSQPPIVHPSRRALLFAINDYPGSQNDLRGCINDQYDLKDKLNDEFGLFTVKTVSNRRATVGNFKKLLNEEVDILWPGDTLLVHYSGHGTYVKDKSGDEADGYDEALYLYDGALIDDDIKEILDKIPEGAIVVMMFDCCYSGTITKSLNMRPDKIRFVQLEDYSKEVSKVKSRVAVSEEMKWITFSGSSAHQTSADAYIDGQYNGAFTYFALRYLKPMITYNQWFHYVSEAFKLSRFEQTPQIEGNNALRNNLVLY